VAPVQSGAKDAVCRAIDARRETIETIGRQIFAAPELGFKEERTARLVADYLGQFGFRCETGLGMTGVKAVVDTGAAGPTLAVLGELDSLLVWEHAQHDPNTGAAHACGHNLQLAAMLGAAFGLFESGVLPSLAGRIAFMAVPAEEFVEIEQRLQFKADGRLEFLAGKQEMLRVGAFDDVDMAMMIHATTTASEGRLGVGGTTNGMVAKFIRYVGHATHASAPHKATNALYAAHVALAGINALRETFDDDQHIRVHPIITRGGDIVSAIPADVRMETFVRGATTEAIEAAHKKIDRALQAGALALGARLELTTIPGYLPMHQDPNMMEVFRHNAESLVGVDNVGHVGHRSGGTDMGDLGHVMPVLHSFSAGVSGIIHGADFAIDDYSAAAVIPAKALATTVVDLLSDGAAGARGVLDRFQPQFTRSGYITFMRSLAGTTVHDYLS
jgi:amidohydrolase